MGSVLVPLTPTEWLTRLLGLLCVFGQLRFNCLPKVLMPKCLPQLLGAVSVSVTVGLQDFFFYLFLNLVNIIFPALICGLYGFPYSLV